MENENPEPKQSRFGWLIAAFIVFSKSTKIVAVLKLMKFTKPLVTVISMLISAIVYGIWLGPWFGVGLVAMLFIHEMGHIIALRIKGIETHGPMFIPFLGAVIFSPKYDDRDTEAFVGYGGPLLGTIGALACFAAWPFTEGKAAEILLLLSYVGVFLNLFNLIPISPLDGGRITQVVGSWFKYVGLAVLLTYTVYACQPGLILIWLIVLDGFNSIPLGIRPAIGIILGAVMTIFMAMGYSGQPLYVDAIDVFLALFFVTIFFYKDKKRKAEGLGDMIDEREYPPVGVRVKWLLCYMALAALTGTVVMCQLEYMPHQVKTHSQQLTTPVVQ